MLQDNSDQAEGEGSCPEHSSGPLLLWSLGPGAILGVESLVWAWLRGRPVLVSRRAGGPVVRCMRRMRDEGEGTNAVACMSEWR